VSLYLGFDCSTQSVTAIVLEVAGGRTCVAFESSVSLDAELPRYGTRHGVLPSADPAVALSSPLLWADALDAMMARVARSGLDLRRLAAISGSAQQHGSVYLNALAGTAFASLDSRRQPGDQLAASLSRFTSPIWMDSSTKAECDEIASAVGGQAVLAAHTGSRAFERFTAAQIRKFFKHQPDAYAATERIHLVSSYLVSLLVGRHAPIDPGDASGTNLMELATGTWWPQAVEATAPSLANKLPAIAAPWTIAGPLARYWQERHGLPAAPVVVWSGDNPCSLIGTGLVREGRVAVSLGTSDTVFGLMNEPRVDSSGTGHVFGAPTGAFMALTCFANGSLARERVRETFGLGWPEFSAILRATPPGNAGRVLLPWFEPEITPAVPTPGIRRDAIDETDRDANVRGVVEAQMMAALRHSRWMGVTIDAIHATGGAAANREILQIMADVFGADVYQSDVRNSACLGAALRARHADIVARGEPAVWDDIVRDIAEPPAPTRLRPRPEAHAVYRDLTARHAAFEAQALGRRPLPDDIPR
jgi:xylulokinase